MLEVKNLNISYDKKVVEDLSFKLNAGQVNVLMGRNGAGKSSILNAISGLIPYKGEIITKGKISYLNQNVNTDANFTAFETIILGKVNSLNFRLGQQDIKDANDIMDLLNISSFREKKINRLSGGEVQKILIAQALISNPKVLLLDEPASALDLKNQYEILTIIKDLTKKLNLTTLIILHQIELIEKFADNIILINQKKLYNMGDKNTIFTKKMFKEVYELDAKIIDYNSELLFYFNANDSIEYKL
ncbi:ABC transporter ATP-binding protein [Anaerococcus nagyae]|jgi:ABC superfamily ATP binding cassette transporter, ABC protein|uniref:ABC transporter ATP-binding protein n=1 Tax=Anaerococcus nagyae TaxID=1755241 RepID=UPI003244BC93